MRFPEAPSALELSRLGVIPWRLFIEPWFPPWLVPGPQEYMWNDGPHGFLGFPPSGPAALSLSAPLGRRQVLQPREPNTAELRSIP